MLSIKSNTWDKRSIFPVNIPWKTNLKLHRDTMLQTFKATLIKLFLKNAATPHLCNEPWFWRALALHTAGSVTLGLRVLSVFHGGAARTSLQPALDFTMEQMRSIIKKIMTVWVADVEIWEHLGDMWFWDSVLQSLATVLVGRSALASQLLTSPDTGPLSSGSTSWTTKGESKDERTGEGQFWWDPNPTRFIISDKTLETLLNISNCGEGTVLVIKGLQG